MIYFPLTFWRIYFMSSNCHFPENISLSIFYLHPSSLRVNKFNLNWITIASICNFLCCRKSSVVKNDLSEWIYTSPCSYHCIFLVLSKRLWKKLSIAFKKFVFLCLLPSLFSFLTSLSRSIRVLILATILLTTSLITASINSKPTSALTSSFFILFSWNREKFHCLPMY